MESPVALIIIRLFLRFLLGLILLSVAMSKLAHPLRFKQGIQDYQLLHPVLESRLELSTILSFGIPVVELLAGLGLLSGLMLTPALILTLCLFVLFSGAIFINLMRRRFDLSCNCGGIVGDHRISWWLIGRNTLLMGSLLILFLTPMDQFTVNTFIYHSSLLSTAVWANTILLVAFLVISVLIIFVLVNVARGVFRPQ